MDVLLLHQSLLCVIVRRRVLVEERAVDQFHLAVVQVGQLFVAVQVLVRTVDQFQLV